MKVFLILFVILTSFSNSFADDEKHPLDNYTILSEAVPTEFKLMINHLKQSELDFESLQRISAASSLINEELSTTPSTNIMFLFKSEIYKGILNNQYMKKTSLLQASTSILQSTKHKLQKHSIAYSAFAKWLIESIIKDFNPYLAKNFINQYQNVKRSNSANMLKARRLQKTMKYLAPWLNAIDKNTPEDFNKLLTKIIIDTIERISKKTYYFKTFSSKLEPESSENIFIVPKIKELESINTSEPIVGKTLKEESKQRKKEAEDAIKSINTDDLSGASSEIDNILENP